MSLSMDEPGEVDIQVGLGVVPYARKTISLIDGELVRRPEGWVLPGGQRTTSRVLATSMAKKINRIMTNGC